MKNINMRINVFLITGLFLASFQALAQDMPPARVRVGNIEQKKLQAHWDVIGRLVENKRTIVAAEQTGKIIQLNVDDGDTVKAGKTILAQIDPIWMELNLKQVQSEIDQAKAMIDEANAQVDQASRDLKFYEDLAAQKSARPKEVDDARTTLLIAKAQLANANASLKQKEIELARVQEELSRLTVYAPFDGAVVAKHTELGQWVNPGDPIVELISTGKIKAHVDVPETLVNNLHANDSATLKIEPIQFETQGKITAIIPDGSSSARTFPVQILLDNPQGKLKVGMSVTAHIPTGKVKPHLTVPRNAILTTSQGSAIWVNMEGKAIRVDVQILFGLTDRYVIQPSMPLKPGMQVVIEGAERLFPTQPLEVINP